MRDKQKDFDSVYTHLLKQGPCVSPSARYLPRYRENGKECAIAHLCPQEKFTSDALAYLAREGDEEFYHELMALHDSNLILAGVASWQQGMKALAEKHALAFNYQGV